MIQWGDLLRVPYTGRLSWDFGVLSIVRPSVAFVLSSTLFSLLDMYIFISVLCFVLICWYLVVRFSEIAVRLGPGSIVRS